MSRTMTIARRELSSYFFSPVAYAALTLFLLACGFLFAYDFVPGKPVAMRNLFDEMIFLLVFIIPILSMGLLAQEWATGTIETLMTAPVTDTNVVVGKFLGSLFFFLVLLAPTLVYVVLLMIFGRLDLGPIVSGYLGILLVGALFIAVGLFCSSLTRSQVVAAAGCIAILFAVTIAPYLVSSSVELPTFWRSVVDNTVFPRYAQFSAGVIDSGNLVFFVIAIGVFLFGTIKIVESRRWK